MPFTAEAEAVSLSNLRSLLRSIIRESWEIPPSGMGATVRRLGRTGTLKGEMVSLNVLLRGLYIDALDAHESGDRETYKQIMGQISEVEQQLADLQTQHDGAETDT